MIIFVSIFILVSCKDGSSNKSRSGTLRVDSSNGLNLRKKPSIQGSIITVLNHGQYVQYISEDNKRSVINGVESKWVKVRCRNYVGWAWGHFLIEEIIHDASKVLANFSNWKLYISSQKDSVTTTDNFNSFNYTAEKAHFTFRYPSIWNKDGVFYNRQKKKVAELMPGIFRLKNSKGYDLAIQTLKKRSNISFLTINGFRVIKSVRKVPFSGGRINWNGVWYPISYIIFFKNKCFGMTFYQTKYDISEHKLFEKILSTLKIRS